MHDLTKRKEAFGGKLVWQMYTKPQSTWCKIMQQKYLDNNDPSRILSILDPPKGSVIWDFVTASQNIVVNYVSCEVNDCTKVKFWRDFWNGQIQLSNNLISLNIIEVSELHWGTQLYQYVAYVCELSGKVFWKDPTVLPLSSQEIRQFKDILSSRQVFFSGSQDRILWALAKDGNYSVKEGYKILQQNISHKVTCRDFSFCWNHIVLPKVGCFTWLALKHRILTSDRLTRLHIASSFNYFFCDEWEESMDHLLSHAHLLINARVLS